MWSSYTTLLIIVWLSFFLEPFSRYGIAPLVLSILGCSILSSKFAQDLIFIRILSSAMYHTGFLFTLWSIYISFTAISSAPILRGVVVWLGGFSSLIPTESSMFGFCPSSFFIRRCYHTFINIISNSILSNIFTAFFLINSIIIKILYIRLLRPSVWRTV